MQTAKQNRPLYFVSLVVKVSDKTIHRGIYAEHQWEEVWAEISVFGTIFPLKIGVLLANYFKEQTNTRS